MWKFHYFSITQILREINFAECVESKLSEEEETLTMKLAKALEPGTKAILTCNFTGELNDKMRGFYR